MKANLILTGFFILTVSLGAPVFVPTVAAQKKSAGARHPALAGAVWASARLDWEDLTDSCPGFFMAEARILYFGAGGEFLMVEGSVERYPPNEFRTAEFWSYGNHSLSRTFAGNWENRAGVMEIKYRLVDDPFSEKAPVGDWRTTKINFGTRRLNDWSKVGNLIFERHKFRPNGKFETQAFQESYLKYSIKTGENR
jgi:hypothetical protein